MKAIASISRTNEILKKFGIHAKKGFGQNFIIEPKIVEKIARLSDAGKQDCVIEIGPGIGALTEQLALISQKVIAYEIDKKLIPVLSYSLSEYANVEVINQDFLKIDLLTVLEGLKKEYANIRVCANLPYYITTPILFKLFDYKDQLTSITVMMQKEVAERFQAKVNTKSYNALSVIVQYSFDVQIVMKIPRTIFNPAPAIDSAVVTFIPKDIIDPITEEQEFFNLVKACFKQRRKTIYNNLKVYVKDDKKAKAMLKNAQIAENARAQEIDLKGFKKLYYER